MSDNLHLIWLVLVEEAHGIIRTAKTFPPGHEDEAVVYAQAAARENPGFRFWVQTAWEAKP